MSFIYPLCSSSKGNSTYVGDKNSGILIDAGISLRSLKRSLAFGEIDTNAIKAIFVTHEHTDHISGLASISAATGAKVYASEKTLRFIQHNNYISSDCQSEAILDGDKKSVGTMTVGSFKTPHDSVWSVGYKIFFDDLKTACVCTDLGCVTDEVYNNLLSSDMVLIESNYDDTLLEEGSYPAFLKRRIASRNGHLSNEDCANTLVDLFNEGTTKFILGHLSENNNRPEVAFKTAISALIKTGAIFERDFSLAVASKRTVGDLFLI